MTKVAKINRTWSFYHYLLNGGFSWSVKLVNEMDSMLLFWFNLWIKEEEGRGVEGEGKGGEEE